MCRLLSSLLLLFLAATAHADEPLIIDVAAPCECCSRTGIPADDFLAGFPDNLPEHGKHALLRVHESTRKQIGVLGRNSAFEH